MSRTSPFAELHNPGCLARSEIPNWPLAEFQQRIVEAVAGGNQLSSLFADAGDGKLVDLYVVLSDASQARLRVAKTQLSGEKFPSMTPACPAAHLFEREIAEQYGVVPAGHPWFKPVRFHASYRPGHDAWGRRRGKSPVVGVTDYFAVEGEEIHEVGVGPVHAGVIEPGHFRFQCHGENVLHLEISLGYQHRGAERTLIGGPDRRSLHTMETLAGDTSVAHATAYCQAIETLAGCEVPRRADLLRAICQELERLANHTGDLGALAGDVGYLPTMSYCGRLRGDFLNLSALLCGSRFGRGMVRAGGVAFDVDAARKKLLLDRLGAALNDMQNACELMFNAASVQARFESTGTVSQESATAIGLVGPAGRACGLTHDVRHDLPYGAYRWARPHLATCPDGDVFARADVRWQEIQRSIAFIRDEMVVMLAAESGPTRVPVGPLRCDQMAVSLTEGWRGEICHVALTDSAGKFSRYKVVDPSFHNWTGLALALRDQQISDFPLCNKSFNLSYCGYDL